MRTMTSNILKRFFSVCFVFHKAPSLSILFSIPSRGSFLKNEKKTKHHTDIIDIIFPFRGLLLVLYLKHSSKGENFFFHSCDYNNSFSFYILRM